MTPRKIAWHQARRPSEIVPRPWMHDDCIEVMEGIIEPHFHVIEHGAGGSTLWFAERVESVLTIESDLDWYREVKSRAPQNVTIIIETVPPLGLEPCDLLFVDGDRMSRPAWIMEVQRLVKPGGYVVFDNANRPEYVKARAYIQSIAVGLITLNRNMEFSQYFVTDFYRMPEECQLSTSDPS